jgi:hypothetical protein
MYITDIRKNNTLKNADTKNKDVPII